MTTNVVKVAMRFCVTPIFDEGYPENTIDDIVLTWHAQAVDSHAAPDAGNLADLCEIGRSWWEDAGDIAQELRAFYKSAYVLQDVTAWRVRPTLSDPVTLVVGTAGTFALGGTFYPPQSCFLVSLHTLVDSRRYRGRMYLPAFEALLGQTDATGGLQALLRESIGRVVAQLANYVAAYEGPDPNWAQCVYSRADSDSRAVVSFGVADHVATQRRRMYTPLSHTIIGLDGDPA